MLFDFSTQQWAELAKSDVGWLNWPRDGRYVYFKRLGSEAAVMRVRVDDHTVEEVAGLKNIKNIGTAGGLWIGLAPDDSPLMLRDIGTEEIYALGWEEP